jgi:hypothetical protein
MLELRNVSKRFPAILAVDNVSFQAGWRRRLPFGVCDVPKGHIRMKRAGGADIGLYVCAAVAAV